ncbi:MAG: hypothetical protein K0S61_3059 [Anaerocolumna sp.]|nr:hypothetical protein [Anaerocolumna sp.]
MTDKVIFSTTDIQGRQVSLDESTWNKHILDGHPEMKDNEGTIKSTIEQPEFIYESGTHPNRDLFFARQDESSYPLLYNKVVVQYDCNVGTIMSSWFCKDVQGVNRERIKYVKNKI